MHYCWWLMVVVVLLQMMKYANLRINFVNRQVRNLGTSPVHFWNGLEQCQLAGAKEVVVLPYFLSAGRHVAEDIPNIVEKFTDLHPELDVRLAPYLGTASQLTDTLLQLAKN